MAKQSALAIRPMAGNPTYAAITIFGLDRAACLAADPGPRRPKEIGIRKVLGATVRHIVRLSVWQFSKPVVIANLLAWPVACGQCATG